MTLGSARARRKARSSGLRPTKCGGRGRPPTSSRRPRAERRSKVATFKGWREVCPTSRISGARQVERGDAPIVARPLPILPQGDADAVGRLDGAGALGERGVKRGRQRDARLVEDRVLHRQHRGHGLGQQTGGDPRERVHVARLRGLAAGEERQAQAPEGLEGSGSSRSSGRRSAMPARRVQPSSSSSARKLAAFALS